MPHQLQIVVEVTPQEVEREKTLGGAISLCVRAAGYEPKQVVDLLQMDKAQLSRWESGAEGVCWPKFAGLMDACGNDAPVLWMLRQRGYDLHSVRRLETSTERENRLLREENAALRRVLQSGAAR